MRRGRESRIYGVDFSGASASWKPRLSRPTVWIAELDLGSGHPRLVRLDPVQELPGKSPPFVRLVELLGAGQYAAAGIDAPFSLPARHLPGGTHAGLLQAVRGLPDGEGRPFPNGGALVEIATRIAPPESAKPMRACERGWGVNTRSALWNGKARPGAPFAAACLALLARSGRPCWPWQATSGGLLVEAFPAAQLKAWNLPADRYSKPECGGRREHIVHKLRDRLAIGDDLRTRLIALPDALDAVLAAFAAIAVLSGTLARDPEPGTREEGWIAVHA